MNKALIFVIVFGILLVAAFSFMSKGSLTGQTTLENQKKVKLATTEGNIVIELYSDMPITTGNFERLVEDGFYEGILFHRVINGFMIQTGDPLTKDSAKESLWGTGGPGYTINDEFTHAGGNKNLRGTISMANDGPNRGGSQFFINLVDNDFLDSKHPVFGKVTEESMEAVYAIAKVQTDLQDRPLEEVRILNAEIIG